MKRREELRDLSSHHHTVLVLAQRVRKAASGDAIDAAWTSLQERFAAELEPHLRIEEEALLPALRLAGEDTLVARTLAEHAEMRQRITAPPSAEALVQFAELLQRHVRFEEKELFEAAQRRLSDAELEKIGQASGSRPRGCNLTKEEK